VNNPQFPKAFSSRLFNLGASKRYFPVKKLNRIGSLVTFFIFIGGSILVFLYGFYITYVAIQKHGPAMIGDKLTVPVIIALVMLLIGLAVGRFAYENWSKGVAVYDQGLVVRDRKGIKPWRWEEIVSLKAAVTRHYIFGIYAGTTHRYSLFNHRNQRLVFGEMYARVEELAKIIQDGISPILYGRAAQKYNTGQTLVFGPVAISKSGIRIGKKVYPWSEVEQVSIQQGILKVTKKDGRRFSGASASASVIPNLNILLSIIHQVVGLKDGEQPN
jgi:hypothetical protein